MYKGANKQNNIKMSAELLSDVRQPEVDSFSFLWCDFERYLYQSGSTNLLASKHIIRGEGASPIDIVPAKPRVSILHSGVRLTVWSDLLVKCDHCDLGLLQISNFLWYC